MEREATFTTQTEAEIFAAYVVENGGEVVTVDSDYTDEHNLTGRSVRYWFVIYSLNATEE